MFLENIKPKGGRLTDRPKGDSAKQSEVPSRREEGRGVLSREESVGQRDEEDQCKVNEKENQKRGNPSLKGKGVGCCGQNKAKSRKILLRDGYLNQIHEPLSRPLLKGSGFGGEEAGNPSGGKKKMGNRVEGIRGPAQSKSSREKRTNGTDLEWRGSLVNGRGENVRSRSALKKRGGKSPSSRKKCTGPDVRKESRVGREGTGRRQRGETAGFL